MKSIPMQFQKEVTAWKRTAGTQKIRTENDESVFLKITYNLLTYVLTEIK